jgi:hypothetical protein
MSGSGHLITLGKDYIMGLRDMCLLSRELIEHLRKARISVLAQAIKVHNYVDSFGNWIDSKDLGLSRNLAVEWDLYLKALFGAGVNIRDSPDQLLWTGGNSSGILSVKNAYMDFYSTFNFQNAEWRQKNWKWDI